MMDDMFNEFLLEVRRRQYNRDVMRNLRDMSNPFNTPNAVFKRMFRFTTELAHDLFLQINPFLDGGQRVTRIPPIIQFFVALHFYCHGSYQKSVGKDRECATSQASVSRCIHNVTGVIGNQLAKRFIKFPRTLDEVVVVKNGFFEKFGFPGVVGAVDGTHISIVPPAFGRIPPGRVYLNRKNFYSINCQVICDANLKILSVNPRYPGSVHDSAIWHMSAIYAHLRHNYFNGDRSSWLLGDSGYPIEPFLMTPMVAADAETPEGRYTYAHTRARNPVERCFGVWKGTLRCLHKDRILHYKPSFAAQIVIACATLHNLLRMGNVENEDLMVDNDEHDIDGHDVDVIDLHQEGVNTRNFIIANYFT